MNYFNNKGPVPRSFTVPLPKPWRRVGEVGFTIIELLVCTVIIALFFGISLASFRGFSGQKELEAEKDKLIVMLETAKNKARAGDSGSCASILRYKVTLATSSYSLTPICNTGIEGTPIEYAIPPSKSIEIVSDISDIYFESITGVTSDHCITIVDTKKENTCYQLRFDESGIINEEKACTCD